MRRKWGRRDTQHNQVNSNNSKQDRRVGQIVHDERGSASVEWRTAPSNYDRPVFEIERNSTPSRGDAHLRNGFELRVETKPPSFNPYDKQGDTFRGRGLDPVAPPKSGKRDLRKLSEWIKTMKAMEERQKLGDTEES